MPAHAARECEDPSYAPAQGKCARLPNAELFYYDTGPVSQGRGEAVVLMDGASTDAPVARALREVVVLFGGRSAEHEVSCVSAASVLAAIDLARKAGVGGEGPVGGVIVRPSADGPQVIATGYNRPITEHDPTAHAEIVAIREAAARLEQITVPLRSVTEMVCSGGNA